MASADYQACRSRLNAGDVVSGKFCRFVRDGRLLSLETV